MRGAGTLCERLCTTCCSSKNHFDAEDGGRKRSREEYDEAAFLQGFNVSR